MKTLHFGYDPYNSLDSWREWAWIMEALYSDLGLELLRTTG